MKRTWDRLINLFFYLGCIAIALFLAQLFCFTTFKIPSYSMAPTLIDGDRIIVNKMTMGARLFNIFASLRGEQVSIYRMPGLGAIKRNDILVFNFPYGRDGIDSIRLDMTRYYVKRCVALPGDTLEIKGGHYRVRGYDKPLGNQDAQQHIAELQQTDSLPEGVTSTTFPYDGRGWTIWEFGPLPIPRKGQTVKLDSLTVPLYRQLIHWEQKKRLRIDAGNILLGDSLVNSYRFEKNYYFVSGDFTIFSQDSRYWGMLPEEYIVGKAVRVWSSTDRDTGKTRWDRIMKKIE